MGSRCNSLLLEVSGGDWLTGIPPGHELKLSLTISDQSTLACHQLVWKDHHMMNSSNYENKCPVATLACTRRNSLRSLRTAMRHSECSTWMGSMNRVVWGARPVHSDYIKGRVVQ